MKRPKFRSIAACLSGIWGTATLQAIAAEDYELWESTVTMKGGPGLVPGKANESKPERICQAPAGEHEMQDLGVVPKYCTVSKMTRSGETTSFQLNCDQMAALRGSMKGKLSAAQMDSLHMTGVSNMNSSVVSRRVDADNIEQTLTMRMGLMQPVTLIAHGTRLGSCKAPTPTSKPTSKPR